MDNVFGGSKGHSSDDGVMTDDIDTIINFCRSNHPAAEISAKLDGEELVVRTKYRKLGTGETRIPYSDVLVAEYDKRRLFVLISEAVDAAVRRVPRERFIPCGWRRFGR